MPDNGVPRHCCSNPLLLRHARVALRRLVRPVRSRAVAHHAAAHEAGGQGPRNEDLEPDFINDAGFIQNLEQHSLVNLCFLLHNLLYEFSPGTDFYFIIDSISCFDVGRLLKDLGTVMELLRNIVNDTVLVPVCKVLLTNPAESTHAITNMTLFKEDPSRLITLEST